LLIQQYLKLENNACRKQRNFGGASGIGISNRTQVFILGANGSILGEVILRTDAKSKVGAGATVTEPNASESAGYFKICACNTQFSEQGKPISNRKSAGSRNLQPASLAIF